MKSFAYQPRSPYDASVRRGQTIEGPRLEKIEEDTPCLNCHHTRSHHCRVKKKASRAEWYWTPRHGWPARCRDLICCRHSKDADNSPPVCRSTACQRLNCDCSAFRAPRKPPKRLKPTKPAAERAQLNLFSK